jgi:hypothetical protein
MNLGGRFLERIAQWSDQPAIREPNGRTISFGELSRQIIGFARLLKDRGFLPGDRAVIQAPTERSSPSPRSPFPSLAGCRCCASRASATRSISTGCGRPVPSGCWCIRSSCGPTASPERGAAAAPRHRGAARVARHRGAAPRRHLPSCWRSSGARRRRADGEDVAPRSDIPSYSPAAPKRAEGAGCP